MTIPTMLDLDDASLEVPAIQHTYTYIIVDPRSNEIIGELPIQNVTYSTVLSSAGTFSGSIVVNAETSVLNLRELTSPGKMTLYVFRDNIIVWGGIIWKRNYDSNTRTISITGGGFESYLDHRLQLTTKYWSKEDQLSIARWLLTSNGSAAQFDIEISAKMSGRMRERTMFGYEFKTTGDELEQLSDLIDGFDWNVIFYIDPETLEIKRKLEFFYPERGLSRETSLLQFEFPGVIKTYSLTEDAENSANSVWAIGTGEGTEQVTANAQNSIQLNAGWPLLETTRAHKSVVVPSTLQGHANSAINRLLTPVAVFEVELRSDIEPEFGTYNLGDWARFRFEDAYFFSGSDVSSDEFIEYVEQKNTGIYDKMARITGIEVTVNLSGIESIKLMLGGDELAEDSGV